MDALKDINILFVAGFGPIARDFEASKKLYMDDLKLPMETMDNGYVHTQKLAGTKYFAIWPLAQAAESCFGTSQWPADVPAPQAWIEFDVEDIEAASEALERQGYKLRVRARVEPWGQTVTRFLSPEGMLVGLTISPWFRQ